MNTNELTKGHSGNSAAQISRKNLFGLLVTASASAIALTAAPAAAQVAITDDTPVANPGPDGVTSAAGVTQTVSNGDNIEFENNTSDGATVTLGGTHINTDTTDEDVVVFVDNGENNITINVLETGVLRGVNGVIFYEGDGAVIVNDGLIEGTGDADEGVIYFDRDADGTLNSITNNGTITSVNGATIGIDTLLGNDPSSGTIGDEEGIARVQITNAGTISNTNGDDTNGDNDAINFNGDPGTTGGVARGCVEGETILCQVELELVNSGTISAARDSSSNAAIRVESDAVISGTITNQAAGEITGASNAIAISGAHADHDLAISNGLIEGTSSSGIWITGAGVSVENLATGTITGGDEGILIEGSVISVNQGDITLDNVAVAADGIGVVNSGVIGGGEAGIAFGENAAGGIVTNNAGGVVTGGTGITSASGGMIINDGTVEGTSGAAIAFSGDDDATVTLGANSTTTGATSAIAFSGTGVHTVNITVGASVTGGVSGSATGTADSLVLSGTGDGGTLTVTDFEDVTVSGGDFTIGSASTGFGDGIVVNGGSLFFNGSSTGGVNATAGTFGGSGTIAGDVTIAGGATLAPGDDGVGTLAIGGDLILSDTSILAYDLGNPLNPASSDLVTVGGDLTLDGVLRVSDAGGFGAGVYRLIDYTGSLTDNGLTVDVLPDGFDLGGGTIQTAVDGQVNLVMAGDVADIQFFDGSDMAADGAIDGGDGAWNLSSTNWTNAAGDTNAAWAGAFAVFQGTAGTVTLGDDIEATGFQFLTDGYVITSGAGANTIELVDAASGVRAGSGIEATIEAALVGAGGLNKMEGGNLFLTGDNTYTGDTTISGGAIVLDGSMVSDVSILSGAMLTGTGTSTGSVNVAGGAILSPGSDGIGTLTVGDVTFAAGSFFDVDVLTDGSSDMLSATGAAQIDGGTVRVLASETDFAASTDYTILKASGGVAGTFGDVTTDLVFLDPTLSYSGDAVVLNLSRNDVDFEVIGVTANQIAVGAALDGLGDNALTDALVTLDEETALYAYDQLSGEMHASVRSVIADDQRVVRNSVLNHLSNGLPGSRVWGQAWVHDADTSFDGNASGVGRDGWGAMLGADSAWARA
ncbi:beta strand repeat-containing protein [Croceicoccus naphthovorans]|nr:autotransporter-associated beta strand repeat-containing protein [Croceicoccus naphthovorans]MBB3991938.1 autotransporter-associated beta strand protein [Croceicoccus naphthovorans]